MSEDKAEVSDAVDQLWRQHAAMAYEKPVNASYHYKMAATKNGVPLELAEAVIRRCERDSWPYDRFETVAKATKPEFWKLAGLACNDNVGLMFDLYGTLCEAGSDMKKHYESDDFKNRKDSILGAITTLQRELAKEPEGSELNLMRLLSYSDDKDYSHVFGHSERGRMVKKVELAGRNWISCKESDPQAYEQEKQQYEKANRDIEKYDEADLGKQDEIYTDQLIALAKSPSVNDLLNFLSVAVEKNYELQGIEHIKDHRLRPAYLKQGQEKMEMQLMMQQIIEWFQNYYDSAPKAQKTALKKAIQLAVKAVYEAKTGLTTHYNMNSMFRGAQRRLASTN